MGDHPDTAGIGRDVAADPRRQAAVLQRQAAVDNARLDVEYTEIRSPVRGEVKRLLVERGERDTNLIFRTLHNTGRVMKTPVSDAVVALEQRPVPVSKPVETSIEFF